MPDKPWISIIGAGRVGCALAVLLERAGYPIRKVASRTPEHARALADRLGSATSAHTPAGAAAGVDIVFLTVPDDVIEPLARQLASSKSLRPGATLVHCAGGLSSEILAPARESGASPVASFHPLQTFPTVEKTIDKIAGTYCCIEGDDDAVQQLVPLAEAIRFRPIRIEPRHKALYHAGAVMACNYLTAVLDAALAAAEGAGIPRQAGIEAMEPLIRATVNHIFEMGTEKALTGPIARGDIQTVERHIEALAPGSPLLENLYRTLGEWTVNLARRKGSIDEATADSIRGLLEK